MTYDNLANAISHILNSEKRGKKICIIDNISNTIKIVIDILKQNGYVGAYKITETSQGKVMELTLLGSINKCGVIKPRFAVKVGDSCQGSVGSPYSYLHVFVSVGHHFEREPPAELPTCFSCSSLPVDTDRRYRRVLVLAVRNGCRGIACEFSCYRRRAFLLLVLRTDQNGARIRIASSRRKDHSTGAHYRFAGNGIERDHQRAGRYHKGPVRSHNRTVPPQWLQISLNRRPGGSRYRQGQAWPDRRASSRNGECAIPCQSSICVSLLQAGPRSLRT